MKSLFAIIRTRDEDRKILYASEEQFNLDHVFNIRDGENSDIVTYRDKIASFFQQYQYCNPFNQLVGLLQRNNFLGYTTHFIIDFFSQERRAQCHELLIEDLIFHIQNIKKPSVTLVLVLQKDSPFSSIYAQYCLTFIQKCLLKLEKDSNLLSNYATETINNVIYSQKKITLFEKEVNQMVPEYERQRCKSVQVRDSVTQIAKRFLDKCELRRNLNAFCQAFVNRKSINFFTIQLQPPSQDMILNPIAINIKGYQTLLVANFFSKDEANPLNRFQAFTQKMIPTQSFSEISNLYHFSMTEIQVYVNHIMMNNQNQMSLILNKITDDSYFVIASTQPHKRIIEKVQNMKTLVPSLNEPISSKQLRQKEKIDSQLCNIIGFKLIRECAVYLYQLDPFITNKKVEEKIESLAEQTTKTIADKDKQYTNLLRYYKQLQKYLGKQIIVQEVALQQNIDLSRLWGFIHKLKDLIGFYYYTKNKRKENYDFLSQFMKNHQINVGSVVSPQQSIVASSQMTDQVIRIVNNKQTIPTSPSQNTPIQSPKVYVDETPIIQDIDNILSKIKSKYTQPPTINPVVQKSPIKIEEPQQDIIKQIRHQTQQKKQDTQNPKILPPKQETKPREEDIQPTLKTEELEELPKKGSAIKQQVQRLKETFKPPISNEFNKRKTENPKIENLLDLQDQDYQEPKLELITTSQFPQFLDDSQSSDYVTPIKRMDAYSQLSYSQSVLNSVPHSEIKNNPANAELIAEEQALLQRLHILQQQLQYEQKRY